MSQALPWILMALAAGALFLALTAFWQSLRAAFGVASVDEVRGFVESEERASLRDEKASLLRSIRDLELDHDSDKLSDADFDRLNGRLRGRAREVLKMLEADVEAYRPQAEKLVAEALAGQGPSPYRSASGEPAEAADAEPAAAADAPQVCPSCDTSNDPDAVFCKKCGARLSGSDEAAEGDTAGAGEEGAS